MKVVKAVLLMLI